MDRFKRLIWKISDRLFGEPFTERWHYWLEDVCARFRRNYIYHVIYDEQTNKIKKMYIGKYFYREPREHQYQMLKEILDDIK